MKSSIEDPDTQILSLQSETFYASVSNLAYDGIYYKMVWKHKLLLALSFNLGCQII